jgi:hypothetical protein
MFHIIYNLPREPITETILSIDEAIKIIQEKGARNEVLTIRGRLIRLPFIDNGVRPTDLVEKIEGFFGSNLADITVKSQLYNQRDGEEKKHYLHLEKEDKKLVVKYLD